MNRREALKRLALLTGGALSMSSVAGFMNGCRATNNDTALQTLSSDQNELVIELTERIIPATDTPGAKAANVNQFIDNMLTNWNTEEEKDHFLEGLEHTNELSNDRHGQNFVDLDTKDKIDIVEVLEQEAQEIPDPKPETDLKPFFNMLKEFTVIGYYTSEVGATQELNYEAVPGNYNACMPYSEVGRAWA